MSLSKYSIKELKSELERREFVVKNKPTKLNKEDMNWENVIMLCEEYIENISSNTVDELYNEKQCIFESSIVAVYGEDAWDYVNELL